MIRQERPSWDEYFMTLADEVATRTTCLRRAVGAIIVKEKRILATGYNGVPTGLRHCSVTGCLREKLGVPSGQRHEICRGLHAEQNALLNCSREQTLGADLYLAGVNPGDNSIHRARPCPLCARLIIQAGIKNVILRIGPNAGDYEIVPAKGLVWHF